MSPPKPVREKEVVPEKAPSPEMAAHNSGQKVEPIYEIPDAEQKQESVREKSSINDNVKS